MDGGTEGEERQSCRAEFPFDSLTMWSNGTQTFFEGSKKTDGNTKSILFVD